MRALGLIYFSYQDEYREYVTFYQFEQIKSKKIHVNNLIIYLTIGNILA